VRLKNALLLACGIALAGCGGDDPTSPLSVSGSMSFTYTGAGAASATLFSASGAPDLTSPDGNGTTPWATGNVYTTSGYTDITASLPKTSSTWDNAAVTINRTTTGTNNISASCVSGSNCTGVSISFGTTASGGYAFVCSLSSGTVTISSISSSNATGTFSGTGNCFSSGGVQSSFTLTNGTFNVGLTSFPF
jgi:hypothetical protein